MKHVFSLKSLFALVCGVAAVQTFAAPQKTWDAIYNAEGEGDYAAAKIEGNIRFGKYTHYKEVQPVSFKVKDSLFVFSVAGNMTVPSDKIEKERFYEKCNETMEAWVSYFNKPRTFGNEDLIINIAGVDLACGDELFAVGDLRIKFTNPKAQEAWATNLEGREKYKREKVVEYRRAEQEHRASLRDVSGMVKDPRDGQAYKTIRLGNTVWMQENLNFAADSSIEFVGEIDFEKPGRFYTHSAALTACPAGWHLPSADDFNSLIKLIESHALIDYLSLKSDYGWKEYDRQTSADDFEFTALPVGNCRYVYSKNAVSCHTNGQHTSFWTNREIVDKDGYYECAVVNSSPGVGFVCSSFEYNSIRCVKD